MYISKLLKLGVALAAAVSMTACIPGGGGGDGDDDNYVEYILSGLTATPSTVTAGSNFDASWSILGEIANEPDDIFTVKLFISPDTTSIAGSQVYTVNCGYNTTCNVGAATVNCNYDVAGLMTCGTNSPVDVSALVAAAGGSVNLVAQVCEYTLCSTPVATALTMDVVGGRSYTDASADESGGAGTASHIDLTGLSVSIDLTTVSADINVTSLPSTAVNINQGLVADGEIEFAWAVQFDVDSDATANNDIAMVLVHRQDDASATSTALISDATAFGVELWTFDAAGTPTVSAGDTLSASFAVNTITLSGDTNAAPTLGTTVIAAPAGVPVRFDAIFGTNVDAYPDAGIVNYVN